MVLCRTRSASHGGRLKVPGAEDLSQSGTSATVWPMSWFLLAAETERGVDWCQVLQVSWRKLSQAVAPNTMRQGDGVRRTMGAHVSGFRHGRHPGPGEGAERERENLTALQAHTQAPAHLPTWGRRRRRPCPAVDTPCDLHRRSWGSETERRICLCLCLCLCPPRWQVLGLGGHRLRVAGHHHQGWRPKAGAPSAQIASLQLRISICPGPRVHGNKLPGPPPSPTVPRRLAGPLGGRAGGPGRQACRLAPRFPARYRVPASANHRGPLAWPSHARYCRSLGRPASLA